MVPNHAAQSYKHACCLFARVIDPKMTHSQSSFMSESMLFESTYVYPASL